jgi:hypothetical protein
MKRRHPRFGFHDVPAPPIVDMPIDPGPPIIDPGTIAPLPPIYGYPIDPGITSPSPGQYGGISPGMLPPVSTGGMPKASGFTLSPTVLLIGGGLALFFLMKKGRR